MYQRHADSLQRTATGSLTQIDPTALHATWKREVEHALSDFDQDHDPVRARDRITALTVSSSDRDAHLALVLALQSVLDHVSGGDRQLKQAREDFSRIP